MSQSTKPAHSAQLASPTGRLVIYGTADAVTVVTWSEEAVAAAAPANSPVAEAVRQLEAYFRGELQRFDVPMTPRGSSFQLRVWNALQGIPFGETESYGDIAQHIGSVPRPVGVACGANPIPILIPCHRVIAANGRLTGFSGGDGIKTKHALLELENHAQGDLFGRSSACYDDAPHERRHHM